jgi:hypothetical protein
MIPTALLVLGIYAKTRGLRAKKHIIAGALLCVLLFGYGTRQYLLNAKVNEFIRSVETNTNIDLPNKYRAAVIHPFTDPYFCAAELTQGYEILQWETDLAEKGWPTSVSASELEYYPDIHMQYVEYCNYFLCYDLDRHALVDEPNGPGNYYFISYEPLFHTLFITKSTPEQLE